MEKKCRANISVRFPFINIRKRPKLCQSATATKTEAETTTATSTARSEDRRLRRWAKDQFEANWQVSCAYQTRSPSQFVCWVCSVPQSRRWLQLNFFLLFYSIFFCIGKGDPANCGAISGDKHARTPTHTRSLAQVKSVWNLCWTVGWFDWPRELWLNNVPTVRVVVVVVVIVVVAWQSIMQNGYCTLH